MKGVPFCHEPEVNIYSLIGLRLLCRNHRVPVRIALLIADDLHGAPALGIDDDGPQKVNGHSLGVIAGYGNDADYLKVGLLLGIELVHDVLIHVDGVVGLYELRVHDHKGQVAILNTLEPEEG